jgi:chromatin assembly factor 1 subunit A
MPVREIMAEYYTGNSSRPIDLTTDSQNTQIKRTGDLLRKIPLKYLRFQEDVRPPYRGTYTSRPVSGMTRLARNPLRRDLPETNYDYDSEAEWVEDEDEAGEDLKSDDEDEDVDDGRDDMDGFLDDEADETANSRRLVIQGDLEPISTGLCWEDRSKRSTNVKMMQYRMEVILGIYHSSSSLVLC